MEWCRIEISSLTERCDLSLDALAPLAPPVEGWCVVDAPIVIEVDLRLTAERPPTASDFDRVGGVSLEAVPLLEALLGARDDVEAARSRVCIASL